MDSVDRIAADVARVYDGEAWHGPSTCDLLMTVGAEAAAAHPVPNSHSIWEIVLHLTAWTREVQRRLEGHPAGTPIEGDWPAVGDPSPAAWADAQAKLRGAHEALNRTLEAFPAHRLDSTVGGATPTSSTMTFDIMLRGLIAHETYHAGQIALLKKSQLD